MSTKPGKTILFVLEHFPPYLGGVETLFQNLTEALAARGHKVSVVTLRLPGTRAHEICNGVEIVRVRAPVWAGRYFFTVLAIPEVFRRARAADLIHTTTYNAALPAWLAARATRTPAAITVHEVFAGQWNQLPGLHPLLGSAYRLFEWAVLHLPFDAYICDSAFTRQRLIRYINASPARTTVVYPSVDYSFWASPRHQPRPLRAELSLAPDTFLYLYFGRPGISKGLESLIDAVPHVQRALPGSRLVLLLAKAPARRYRAVLQQIAGRGLNDFVVVLDPVPRADLPGYLLAADCVVVPSISEGFGYAAVEAATLGCRVVATAGHSVEEILSGHITLVPARDSAALAAAIISQAGSPPATRPPQRFDLPSHIAGILNVYEALL